MTFFAYLALIDPPADEQAAAIARIQRYGCSARPVHFAREHGVMALYGVALAADRLIELELSAQDPTSHLEGVLLDPRDPTVKWQYLLNSPTGLLRTWQIARLTV